MGGRFLGLFAESGGGRLLGLFLRLWGLIPLGGGLCFCQCIDQLSGNGNVGLVIHLCMILAGLFHRHFVDIGRDFFEFCQLTGSAASIPGHKLELAVLTQTEDNGFFHAACLDAAYQAAVVFVRLFLDKHSGQVMDFGQGDHLGGRVFCGNTGGLAGFICHIVSSLKYCLKLRLTVRFNYVPA